MRYIFTKDGWNHCSVMFVARIWTGVGMDTVLKGPFASSVKHITNLDIKR